MTEKRTLTEEQQKLKEKFSDEADGSIEARVRELRQQASEKIREKLNQPGSGKPTLEEFKQMVYEDQERRKLKNRIKRLFRR